MPERGSRLKRIPLPVAALMARARVKDLAQRGDGGLVG